MSRFANPTTQYLDDAGNPLVSGKLYFFESDTDTPKATYADVNLSIANTHPVILTGSGRVPNIFFDGTARVKLTDSDDVQIFDKDPVGGDDAGGNFDEWSPLVLYSENSIVQGSDDNFYISFTSGNEGNDPTTTPTEWQQIEFINIWNTNVIYDIGDTVKASDNLFYIARTEPNQGNDPTSSPTDWGPPFTAITSIVSGDAITVDATDPENPITNLDIEKEGLVVAAAGDLIAIADVSDTNAIKKVTAQTIADIAPQGDVVGPASATDDSLARFDGTTGKLLKDGAVIGVDVQAYIEGPIAKNLIINGGFQINQREYVSGTATADGVYMHDRWRSGSADSSYTFSVAAPNSPQTITIAANDSIEQVIEGANIGEAGTHTISWEGTATARAVVNTQTMSGNFAVSPITVTAVLDQVITMQFTGADAVGGSTEATDTGTLGKVQCEIGSVATDFEHEDIGIVLAKCQRYFHVMGNNSAFTPRFAGYQSGGTAAVQSIALPTEMRIDPSVTVNGTWLATNCGQPLFTADTKLVAHTVIVTALGSFISRPDDTSDNVEFDAEL